MVESSKIVQSSTCKMPEALLIGFLISFLGSIPIGVLSITAIKIGILHGKRKATLFCFFTALPEILYAYITYYLITLTTGNESVLQWIHYIAIPLFLVLAYYFWHKVTDTDLSEDKQAHNKVISEALALGILNPLSIPFWYFWMQLTIGNSWADLNWDTIHSYIGGVYAGTVIILIIYGILGNLILAKYIHLSRWINKVIGVIFFLLAAYEIFEVLKASI